jgi:SAM-dependent methyltransferase
MNHPENVFLCKDFLEWKALGLFDTVVSMFGSMNYIMDPISAIQKVKYLLKPKGKFLIMLFGKRYIERKSYIVNSHELFVPALFYTRSMVNGLFEGSGLKFEVVGMNRYADRLRRLQNHALLKYLRWESKKMKKQDEFLFHIIVGEKNAKA